MATGSFTIGRLDPSAVPTSITDVEFGFRQGFLFELVDTSEPQRVISAFIFPIAPMKYSLSEPQANSITPTQGRTVVAEESGTILRDIMLEGTFGLSKKRASGFEGAQGGGAPISGNEHFRLLRNLFRQYSDLKQDPVRAANIQLRFHSLREDDHFIVIPKNFDQPLDSKITRLHYEYRIPLTAIGLVDDVLLPRTISDDTNFFSDALKDISKALNDVRGFFIDANSFLVNDVQRGTFGNLQALLLNVGSVINATSSFLRSGAGFINLPFQFVVNVCNQVEQMADDIESGIIVAPTDALIEAARNLRRMESGLDRIASWPDRFEQNWNNRVRAVEDAFAGERRVTTRDVLSGTAGATRGLTTRVAYGSEGDAGIDLGGYDAVISVPVLRTDSLLGLSARYSVPVELIAIINDLRAPYFTDGGGAGTLGPGDTILIPVATGGRVNPGAIGGSESDADALIYGTDLALDQELFEREGFFEIKVDTAHGAMDAEVISGVPNVVQGLEIIVETERGSTVYLPDLGIKRTVGAKGTINQLVMTSLVFREAILSDPRIEKIESASVILDGDVLSQELFARLVSRRSNVSLVRPIGRASGGS